MTVFHFDSNMINNELKV